MWVLVLCVGRMYREWWHPAFLWQARMRWFATGEAEEGASSSLYFYTRTSDACSKRAYPICKAG